VLTLNAAGLWSYWKYRFVLALLRDNDMTSLPNGADTNLTNLSYRTIAKRLVQQAQGATGGRLPVVFEDDIVGTYVRNYAGSDLNRLDQMLQNLTSVINGPDIAFRPRFKDAEHNYVEWSMLTGDPELKADEDHAWDMTTVPNPSVKGAKIDRDGTTFVQVDYEQGDQTDEGDQGTTLATKSVDFDALEPDRVQNAMPDPVGLGGWTAQAGTGGTADMSYQTNGPWVTGDAPPSWVTTAARLRWSAAPTATTVRAAAWGPSIPVTPGDEWTTLLRVTQGTGANRHFAAYARFVDGAGAFLSDVTGADTAISAAGTWAELTQVVTVPAGAAGMMIGWAYNASSTLAAAGDTVYATAGLAVREATYSGGWFDGDTPLDLANDHEYAWDGEPQASPSARFRASGVPRMEDSGNRSGVSEMDTLQSYADDATLTGRQLEETWSFSAKIDQSPTVQDYDEGDYAVLKFKNEPRVGTVTPRMRITQYKVTLGDSFVQIDCAPERVDG
jgi:hypothetical protein